MNNTRQSVQGSIAKGIGLTLALHGALVVCVAIAAARAGPRDPEKLSSVVITPWILVQTIGVIQLVYLGPACAVCFATGKRRTALGLALGAGITILLNAAWCGGIAMAPR